MMGIEFKNVRLMTKEQHNIEVAENRAEQYRQIALSQEQVISLLQHNIKVIRKKAKALRSQLSEALGKIREYREAEVQAATALIVSDAVESIGKTISNWSAPVAGKAFATGGIFKNTPQGTAPSSRGEYVIPHHGAGLSEAEDAFKADCPVSAQGDGVTHQYNRGSKRSMGVVTEIAFTQPDTTGGIQLDIKPEVGTFDAGKFDIWTGKPKRQLRLIMEKAPFGGIYYKLQDRKTLRLIQNGIAADVAAVVSIIPESDRERIYETRRYGMGVE